jgi:hypothetical protein
VQRVQLYPHEEQDEPPYLSYSVGVASLQPFLNLAKDVHGGFDKYPGNATMIYLASPSCHLNGQTGQKLVTRLVTPIHDMWYVRVVNRIHYRSERSLTTP